MADMKPIGAMYSYLNLNDPEPLIKLLKEGWDLDQIDGARGAFIKLLRGESPRGQGSDSHLSKGFEDLAKTMACQFCAELIGAGEKKIYAYGVGAKISGRKSFQTDIFPKWKKNTCFEIVYNDLGVPVVTSSQ